MTETKTLLLAIFLLATATHCSAQKEVPLLGRWVNEKDTNEYIILAANGEFKMVSNNFNDGGSRISTGMWIYKGLKKKLILVYGPRLPKQIYKVRDNGSGNYTIH